MDKMSGKLTIFFEDPFWIGVFEEVYDGKMSVCKVTFGSEPKDYDIKDFILKHYYELKFSPAVNVELKLKSENPKRKQRNARKEMQGHGIRTKSQQALQKQREEMKVERRQIAKEMREAKKQEQFELKQQKKKEKHKGH